MGTYCLSALKDSMNNFSFNLIALSACLALVRLPFTVDAGYVSKQEKRNCHTEYETVTTYENQCSTSYEQECSTVKDEHCTVRTCMPTLSCPEAPPCTPVLLTVCRRRSLPLLHPPSRSRSLLHQRGSTLSGSEDPSLLPSPPSSRCGSPSRSMMSAAHPLSTASASK